MRRHEAAVGVIVVALVIGLVLVTSQPLREHTIVQAGSTKGVVRLKVPDSGKARAAILGYLQTRDHRITVYPDGIYTVATAGGKVLAEKVTLGELKATDPGLHEILKSALANQKRTLDARSNRRSLMPPPARQ